MLFIRIFQYISTESLNSSTMIRKNHVKVATPHQTISTDGAKFSLKGIIPRQKKGYRKINSKINIHYRGYGHQQFETVAEVFLENEKIGVMDLHPRALLNPDTVLFSVDNRIQYSEGWTDKVKEVWKGLNLSFSHTCRLDIATDSPYSNQFDFIQEIITGKLKQVGSTRFSPLYDGQNSDGSAKLIYFTFGSRSSDKFIRAYYKRQELAKSNKQYIMEFWNRNGFELGDNQEVARFEIVLKRKELKKYEDTLGDYGDLNAKNLHLLENTEYLATLFNTAKKGFFEFVSNRSFLRTGNISRCVRKMVLDLSDISCNLLNKITSKATNHIFTAKMTAKMLYLFHCKTDEKHYMLQVEEILHNFNLTRWFYANVDKYYKEYLFKMKSGTFEYLRNYTSDPKLTQMNMHNLSNF